MVTFSATMSALTQADSEMPMIRTIEMSADDEDGGKVDDARLRTATSVRLAGQREAEVAQQPDQIVRPADRDGCGADRVFEHEIPADDPREKFAHGGVGVGIGAAGDRDHGGEFAVAHAGEGASDGGDDEGEDHGGSGVIVGGDWA